MTELNPLRDSRFCNDLGFEVLQWGEGKAILAVTVEERMTNRHGAAHGGLVSTLIDSALGMACRYPGSGKTNLGTVNLNINFLARGQGRLVAEGRVMRSGASLAFCEGEVTDETGTIVAKAIASFKVKAVAENGAEQ